MFIYIYCNLENLIYNYFKKKICVCYISCCLLLKYSRINVVFFNVNVLRECLFNIYIGL